MFFYFLYEFSSGFTGKNNTDLCRLLLRESSINPVSVYIVI